MKLLRSIFDRANWSGSSRFERYYGDLVQQGAGYPTADEARSDLRRLEATNSRLGWGR
jgi:hypothetical protein